MSAIRDSGTTPEGTSEPELVFCIAGAIGVDLAAIRDGLTTALRSVRYETEMIHLTNEMMAYNVPNKPAPPSDPSDNNFYSDVLYKIKYANALCEEFKDAATLARIGMRAIATRREGLTSDRQRPSAATAYIIRQLKRPAEVALFRRVYGKRFVLVSAYGSAEQRQRVLEGHLRRTLVPSTPEHEIASKAIELITIDASEEGKDYGQQLRETFHLADVFIDGLSKPEMDEKLHRFIQVFFGRTDIIRSKNTECMPRRLPPFGQPIFRDKSAQQSSAMTES
jgi:hypothetical protein